MSSGGGGSPDYSKDPRMVSKMARLISSGAVMLSDTCPLDGLPLFRTRSNDIICPQHGKVYIVESREEAMETEIRHISMRVAYYAAKKLEEGLGVMEPEEMERWLSVIKAAQSIIESFARTPPQEAKGPSRGRAS